MNLRAQLSYALPTSSKLKQLGASKEKKKKNTHTHTHTHTHTQKRQVTKCGHFWKDLATNGDTSTICAYLHLLLELVYAESLWLTHDPI